jgi:hypothetical protein|tara:strand:- start:83 stop:502 length:420 start_codon:yes stop_codon:yes gene_type:complete
MILAYKMIKKSKKILVEISPGELLDKISILEIKLKKIKDKENLSIIKNEYRILKSALNLSIKMNKEINVLFSNIKKINQNLWNIEDKIRICEKNKSFKNVFIKLARDVYFNNDKRAKIKYKINNSLGSKIIEIKKYSKY